MSITMNSPMTSRRLYRFQDQFARALADVSPSDDGDGAVAKLVTQPGFAVYRNTVRKGCIDALVANYPAVARLVGEEWMRAAAAEFSRNHPPRSPLLLEYGVEFAAFLRAFEPAAELPYLDGVARLDRLWTEAHFALDESPLAAERVAALGRDDLARTRVRPHASARWAWFDELPIFSVWSRNRNGTGEAGDIAWCGEGALVVRPFDTVHAMAIDRADVVFLDACAAGRTLAEAALATLGVDPAADLAQTMARLLSAGAFGQMEINSALPEESP
jgi:hypothetical protein